MLQSPPSGKIKQPAFVTTRKVFTFALLAAALFGCIAWFAQNKSQAKNLSARDSLSQDVSPDVLPTTTSGATKSSDGLWRDVAESELATLNIDREKPKSYRSLELNEATLAQILTIVPLESTAIDARHDVVISLPHPDGRLWRFELQESPLLSSELAAKFPEIKTYRGQGIDDPTATMRFTWTPKGLNAFVISTQGSFMVSPYSEETQRYYLSFFTHDVEGTPFECGAGFGKVPTPGADALVQPVLPVSAPLVFSGGTRREYRLSFTVTQQFYQHFGGQFITAQNDMAVVATISSYVSNLSAIYERELSIRFKFHSWIADVPGLCGNPGFNCFSPAQDPQQMLPANQYILDNIFPGGNNYDLGSALGYSTAPLPSGYSSFGSGGAGGACEAFYKGQSATRLTGTAGDYLGTVILAHELGHMYGARHTFNSAVAGCANGFDPFGPRVEPGSGSTIMSYVPVCGADNLFTGNAQNAANNYFHVDSLIKMANHRNTFYPSCGQSTTTGNSPPLITDGGANATIPALTPFTLTATATDSNGDAITYTWEEYDSGTTLFRSYTPTTNPARTFPSLTYILNNGNVPPIFVNGFFSGEILPNTSRPMNFTVTVRDNRSGGGGTSAREQLLQVNVVGNAGPFVVTQPNTALTLPGGAQSTITWNVANTNFAPIGTSNVRILLSTDGGNTFPTVLASSTPNDGSAAVTLPNLQTSTARIKIEAVGNIFFDISNTNFSISQAGNVQFGSAAYTVNESAGTATATVTRTGDTSVAATVDYASSNGTALERTDYAAALGTLSFAPGETTKSITIFITNDVLAEVAETLTLTLSNPSGASVSTPAASIITITDNDPVNGVNPVRWNAGFDSTFFVRQHYVDFFNREPDAAGLAFWKNQLDDCTTQSCREIKRANVSAAFFVSIEFQETGYLVYRFYQAAYGRRVAGTLPLTLGEFLPDVQEIGRGIVVGQGNWQQQLEQKKQIYSAAFVNRADFIQQYPQTMSAAQFIDALNTNTGGSLSPTERNSLVNRLGAGQINRAQAIREVADDTDFQNREYNRAFVLMQYFGYLRRNPNAAPDADYGGYNFWVAKLDSHGGNFITAEMVKAFITSGEYVERFGP